MHMLCIFTKSCHGGGNVKHVNQLTKVCHGGGNDKHVNQLTCKSHKMTGVIKLICQIKSCKGKWEKKA